MFHLLGLRRMRQVDSGFQREAIFGKILPCGAVVKIKWPFPSVQEKNCGFLKIAFFVCSAVWRRF